MTHSTRFWQMLSIVGGVLILVLLKSLAIPEVITLTGNIKQITVNKKLIEQSINWEENLQSLRVKKKRLENKYQDVISRNSFRNTADIPVLIDQVCKKNNVSLVKMQPVSETKKQQYTIAVIEAEINGSYKDSGLLIEELEQLHDNIYISQIEMTTESKQLHTKIVFETTLIY